MKNIKIFPKMFLQTFLVLGVLIVFIHTLVLWVFPKTYLESRKEEIYSKANEVAHSLEGKAMDYVEQSLDFYSNSSAIKAFVKGETSPNAIEIAKTLNIDPESGHNSLIIEEREVLLKDGEKVSIQFVSTADMQREARELSFKFLPYSLLISFFFSIIVSLIYAKAIKHNIQEIKDVTDKMMDLDKEARLEIDSKNEIGELKGQINALYGTLLQSIDDLELKNREILRLEKLKYDFFRGASHELKTPLASLKIILENMKYNIGKYKNRDLYIDNCIGIVDGLTQNISHLLSISSLDSLQHNPEKLIINESLREVLKKYTLMAEQKNIRIQNTLTDEEIYMDKTALKMILSNLLSNAVKYTDPHGLIRIGSDEGWFFIENTYEKKKDLDIDRLFEAHFDLKKENNRGIGLYIVGNLLHNYEMEYKAEESPIGFVFKIKILD